MCENPETFKNYLMPVLEKIRSGERAPSKDKAEAKA
jgi:hypothetical protein